MANLQPTRPQASATDDLDLTPYPTPPRHTYSPERSMFEWLFPNLTFSLPQAHWVKEHFLSRDVVGLNQDCSIRQDFQRCSFGTFMAQSSHTFHSTMLMAHKLTDEDLYRTLFDRVELQTFLYGVMVQRFKDMSSAPFLLSLKFTANLQLLHDMPLSPL